MKEIKEQADELVNKSSDIILNDEHVAILVAIKSVELVIESQPTLPIVGNNWDEDIDLSTEYWNEVLKKLKSRI